MNTDAQKTTPNILSKLTIVYGHFSSSSHITNLDIFRRLVANPFRTHTCTSLKCLHSAGEGLCS